MIIAFGQGSSSSYASNDNSNDSDDTKLWIIVVASLGLVLSAIGLGFFISSYLKRKQVWLDAPCTVPYIYILPIWLSPANRPYLELAELSTDDSMNDSLY